MFAPHWLHSVPVRFRTHKVAPPDGIKTGSPSKVRQRLCERFARFVHSKYVRFCSDSGGKAAIPSMSISRLVSLIPESAHLSLARAADASRTRLISLIVSYMRPHPKGNQDGMPEPAGMTTIDTVRQLTGTIPLVVLSVSRKLQDSRNKWHLPKSGGMLGETCGFLLFWEAVNIDSAVFCCYRSEGGVGWFPFTMLFPWRPGNAGGRRGLSFPQPTSRGQYRGGCFSLILDPNVFKLNSVLQGICAKLRTLCWVFAPVRHPVAI